MGLFRQPRSSSMNVSTTKAVCELPTRRPTEPVSDLCGMQANRDIGNANGISTAPSMTSRISHQCEEGTFSTPWLTIGVFPTNWIAL